MLVVLLTTLLFRDRVSSGVVLVSRGGDIGDLNPSTGGNSVVTVFEEMVCFSDDVEGGWTSGIVVFIDGRGIESTLAVPRRGSVD